MTLSNDPTFGEVWTNAASAGGDPRPRRPLVAAALEDTLIESDVADLIATWPLCQLFKLQPGDHAVVAGSYQGKVVEALMDLYPGIKVDGFEPQRWANERAVERLNQSQRQRNIDGSSWRLWPFALGDRTAQNVPMGEFGTDACSFINVGPQAREHGSADMVDVVDAFNVIGGKIDLLVLNCEGFEFRLIRHMIHAGILQNVKRLAIQWHLGLEFDDDTDERDMQSLLNGMLGSPAWPHRLVYDDRPTWTYSEARNAG